MVIVCTLVLIGLGLAVGGVILACATQKGRDSKVGAAPPLPPRVNVGNPPPLASYPQAGVRNAATLSSLPARRSPASTTAAANPRTAQTNYGPRGIKPTQFPCCPYDKLRNVPGGRQVIFWDSQANCYRCSRGHRFKSNGKSL